MKNCAIDRCETGFKIHDSQGPIRIENSQFRNNNRAGLDIHRSQRITVAKSLFKGNGKTVPNLRIGPNGFYKTDQYGGIFVKDDSSNIVIMSCQILGNKHHGLSVYKGSTGVKLFSSTLTGNSSFGVFVSKKSTLLMRACKISKNGVGEDSERGEIYVGSASRLRNRSTPDKSDFDQKVMLKDGGIYQNR